MVVAGFHSAFAQLSKFFPLFEAFALALLESFMVQLVVERLLLTLSSFLSIWEAQLLRYVWKGFTYHQTERFFLFKGFL